MNQSTACKGILGNDEFVITVSGSFDHFAKSRFIESYREVTDLPDRVRVDLSDVSFMDSTALGALLNLRSHVGEARRPVIISGASETVRCILETANFQKLFSIE